MKTKLSDNEEQLEVSIEKLDEAQQLSKDIGDLKIELHSKINKLKGKREKLIKTNIDDKLKQEEGDIREIKEVEENI